jgi:uncharacterized membrane protein
MAIQQTDRPGGRYQEGRRRSEGNGERLAQGLGWFSLGLGLAQIAAPGGMARLIGVPDDDENQQMMRAVGMREVASGLGILSQRHPEGWAWARVGGDVMDLSLLGGAWASDRTDKERVAAATVAVVGVLALDLLCGRQLSDEGGRGDGHGYMKQARRLSGHGRTQSMEDEQWSGAVHVRKSVTINRPAEELYRFWRDFDNLPRFMTHLEEIRKLNDKRSHWKAKGPVGFTFEWDAEITEDRPNERLAWASVPGSSVHSAGSVNFKKGPGGRGTVVEVEMRVDPPGGAFGAKVAKLFGKEPGQQVTDHLRAFKQIMETGHLTRSDASFGMIKHPASPPSSLPRELQAELQSGSYSSGSYTSGSYGGTAS